MTTLLIEHTQNRTLKWHFNIMHYKTSLLNSILLLRQDMYLAGFLIRFLACTKLAQVKLLVSQRILTAPTMLNIGNSVILFSAKIQYFINSIGPCYFTIAPMWPKSYHDTGPQGTFCAIGPIKNPDI